MCNTQLAFFPPLFLNLDLKNAREIFKRNERIKSSKTKCIIFTLLFVENLMTCFNNRIFYNIFIAQRMCVLLAELIQTFFLFIFFSL